MAANPFQFSTASGARVGLVGWDGLVEVGLDDLEGVFQPLVL